MKTIITKEALKILAMNNASCKVFGEKRVKNLKYLTECAKLEKDFDFDALVNDLPEQGIMYASIKAFSRLKKTEIIDLGVMYEFLGGNWHIQYVKEQNELVNMNKVFGVDFSDRFLFSHIIIPATIVSIDKSIIALYENAEVSVFIKNVLLHPFVTEKLHIGSKVLLHQALVIGVNPSGDTTNDLLSWQKQDAEFMEVAKRIQNIDYEYFWNMKQWTEEIIKDL
jgi:hypothetical protein